MKFLLVFVSPNGTTRVTAKLFCDIIGKNNHTVESIDLGNNLYRDQPQLIFEKLKNADIVGFGSPAYHMDMLDPIKKLLQKIVMLKKENNYQFKAFIFLNYAGITSGKAFINTAKTLKQAGISVIGGVKLFAPHLHHNEEFPTNETVQVIEEFYHRLQSNNFSEIKWVELKRIFSPQKAIVNVIYPFVHILGKLRELPIKITSEKCKKCKKCIKECPVGAINLDNIINIEANKCIHCYHCVLACPFEAIESPIEKLDDMIKMNKRIVGMEKPLNRVLINI